MNAMPLILLTLAVFAIAYKFYYSFIAAKVAVLDDSRETPAHRLYDGHNYYPMSKWVLFGHHFAAIAGAGPLVGPVLAAQFGFLPGFLWLLLGVVIAGAVQDFIIFAASVRHDGKSLAEIARSEISPLSGVVASLAILVIIVVALAGLGIVVVNALAESSWGTFAIGMTIPIALFMGMWMFKFRKGKIVEATVIGVLLLTLAVVFGKYIPESSLAPYFTFDHKTLTILMAAYGFFASVLPVWLLLSPRDYLSSFMKLGVVAFLALGVIIVAPTLKMPAFTIFDHGGGPIIPGPLYPYLFITIACGAISGFHALVSSGTSPKMVSKESHIRTIAFTAMLAEGFVGILALIAATSLYPHDFFQINVPVEKFAALAGQLKIMGFSVSNLAALSKEVGEQLAGRTGGAVSLAVGMAQIFSSIPGLKGLMAYWYHFAIMFEALFILTTIDAGTRIGRFVLQETLGKVYKPFSRTNWMPGTILTSAVIVFAWAYFIYTGTISTIWPMFGAANQLLATIALAVGTTYIINRGRAKYAWVTSVPMVFVGTTTLTAGWMNMTNIYYPMTSKPGLEVPGYINFILTAIIMASVVIILFDAVPKWYQTIRGTRPLFVEEQVTK
ncbi:MAG: carbon starvation protein A [Bacteroidetes bacterium]|nr:carbon starvation protein A [Bacteroidota bacterium]MCL5738490.1 carbon starvation protein A [Bacteroidota bacterium]